MIIKDSMVLIHLAKLTLLEKSCNYFKDVKIARIVCEEVVKMVEGHSETKVIKELVEKNKIKVRNIQDRRFMEKANEYNIQRGEAESVALYWQEKANLLATDDDNVRKKRVLLNLNIIGTPVIILKLYSENFINKEKFKESITELKRIGWFSNAVLDKILMEGLK